MTMTTHVGKRGRATTQKAAGQDARRGLLSHCWRPVFSLNPRLQSVRSWKVLELLLALLLLLSGPPARGAHVNPAVVATVPVGPLGDNPLFVGVNAATDRVYTSNHSSNSVSVINGATNAVVATVRVGLKPEELGVNAATDRVYVTNLGSNNVSVINGATNAVVATVPVGTGPVAVGVNAATDRVYVANHRSNSVSVIGAYEVGAVFTVNTTADHPPGPCDPLTVTTDCTLREAIMEANAAAGADTIDFDPSVFNVPQTITLGSPLPAIAQDLTITGPGAPKLTVNGAGTGSIFRINPTVPANLSDLTITGGKASAISSYSGGGILTGGPLTLSNVTVRDNTAWDGGGISKTGFGTVTLNNSTVSGNSAYLSGGIVNYQGTLILNNSTVSGNSAVRGAAGIGSSNYGAALTLNNSTVSGNVGVGLHVQAGTVTLKNTILANNTRGNCEFSVQSQLTAAVISRGHNLSTDIWCEPAHLSIGTPNISGGLNGEGDLNNTPAQLAPLGNYGGPTQTHALCTGAGQPVSSCGAASPAIDGASCTASFDQRGVPRPQGSDCDIGAYESTACVIAPSGLVGWWPLDETSGTTVTDIVGGYNGTALPGAIGKPTGSGPVTSIWWPPPTFPPGLVGTSLFFSGNRRVEVPHNDALDPGTGDFTIDAWVIYAAAGNDQVLAMAQKNSGATEAFGNTPDGWRFTIRDYSTAEGGLSFRGSLSVGGSVEEAITPNTWHHVCSTLSTDASGFRIVKNYVDGVSSSQVGLNGNITSTAPLLIGGDGIDAGQIAVDELEIFNRALTQQEIQAIYEAGPAGKCEPPLAPPITGKKLLIKDNPDTTKRQIAFESKDGSIIPRTPSGSDDPRCSAPAGGGGSLWVFGTGGSGQRVVIPLPCENWQAIGNPASPKGYKYKDREQDQGPCKTVEVKKGKYLKAACTGKNPNSPLTYDLTASGEGRVGVVLSTGSSIAYCAEFQGSTGTVIRDDETLFRAKDAPAPAGCPMPPS